ncbi:MAG: SIS domain-containing protein [Candidatus Kerfeldbacteria bacterium]|nr:SIS domain-containing protein [Candidatus Kerfeldbacteria bacterium]
MVTTPLDQHNVLGSIDLLSQQISQAWHDVSALQLPADYSDIDQVVVFGMGGSALGADIIRTAFADTARVPILIENNYTIPAYVHQRTLAILSSYSGTTEETLTVAKAIKQRTNKVAIITTGGALQELHQQAGYPAYLITPTYNPCGQPRIAVGYAIIGLLGLLHHAKVLTITNSLIDDVVHYLDGNRELLRDDAKQLAQRVTGHIPLFVGSEFLIGNLHTVSNQTNENGKNFSTYFTIPELNHHLLEGLSFPASAKQLLHMVLIESALYHERNQKRYVVTKQVLDKNEVQYSSFIATANTTLLQVFEVLQWGSYISFYLAMANQVDPALIPWVDYFKHALTQVRAA